MSKIRQYSLIAALAGIGILALGWFMLVTPKRDTAAEHRIQAEAQRSQEAALRTQLATLQAQQRGLPKQRARLAELATRIPDNPALPSLVRSLTDAAEQAGAGIVSIAPGQVTLPTTAAAGAAPVAPTTPAAPTTSVVLATIPLTLIVEGDYFAVEQFMSNLETLKRAFRTSGLKLVTGKPQLKSTTEHSDGGQYTGVIQSTINAAVFMTVVPPAPAPVAAPAAPVK
jgi:Tfp pilus assembly protein PilO